VMKVTRMFPCLSARLLIVVVRSNLPGRPGPDAPNATIERDDAQSFDRRSRHFHQMGLPVTSLLAEFIHGMEKIAQWRLAPQGRGHR
jgi:hypothetical protein